jgi:predicted  nucleic acid-binding Zn-ribbon protein
VGSYNAVSDDLQTDPGADHGVTVSDEPARPEVVQPRGLHDLLRVQQADLAIDRLQARRAVLEGGAEVAEARERAAELGARVGEARLSLDDVAREQARLEHDVDAMGRKRADEEKRLYDGSVANARELQSIRAEVESIANRISRTEDRLLELMEQRETIDAELAGAVAAATEARDALDTLTAGSADEYAQVEAGLEVQRRAREATLPAIDPDLLALYEDLRRQKKGVGVAELRDGVCQGCHQKLSPMVLDRLRHTSGVRRCEYCRRILVFV